jgi:hypothetical protein
MPWFKVDDGLHKSRKRIRLGRSIEGWAALGLWTHLGSWSADELTEGFISDDDLEYMAPGLGCDMAKRLEAVGLFERVTRDGDDGWLFHDWDDYQPSKEDVLADRAANAARQKRFRDKAKAKREAARQAESDGSSNDGSNGNSNGVTNALVTPSVTVPPTRPDPYLEELKELPSSNASLFELETVAEPPPKKQRASAADEEPERFAEFYDQAYPRKQGRLDARAAYAKALKKRPAGQLVADAFAYREYVKGRDREHILLPTTWLNGEHWNDDISKSNGARSPTGHQSFQADPKRNFNDGEL